MFGLTSSIFGQPRRFFGVRSELRYLRPHRKRSSNGPSGRLFLFPKLPRNRIVHPTWIKWKGYGVTLSVLYGFRIQMQSSSSACAPSHIMVHPATEVVMRHSPFYVNSTSVLLWRPMYGSLVGIVYIVYDNWRGNCSPHIRSCRIQNED